MNMNEVTGQGEGHDKAHDDAGFHAMSASTKQSKHLHIFLAENQIQYA